MVDLDIESDEVKYKDSDVSASKLGPRLSFQDV